MRVFQVINLQAGRFVSCGRRRRTFSLNYGLRLHVLIIFFSVAECELRDGVFSSAMPSRPLYNKRQDRRWSSYELHRLGMPRKENGQCPIATLNKRQNANMGWCVYQLQCLPATLNISARMALPLCNFTVTGNPFIERSEIHWYQSSYVLRRCMFLRWISRFFIFLYFSVRNGVNLRLHFALLMTTLCDYLFAEDTPFPFQQHRNILTKGWVRSFLVETMLQKNDTCGNGCLPVSIDYS